MGWKSTLNRLELPGGSKRYHKIDYAPEKIDALLLDVYIESHAQPPEQIVLDLDATDIPLYGHQPERFFHGYYDRYCYLPLYIFAADQLLCARLRASNMDGAAGALDEVKRIVARLRAQWPKVRIVLRGDSGFCREELMAWCESEQTPVQRLALKGTEWAEAQVDTIRLKLFKIGALVRISAPRVWLELNSNYPWKHIYAGAFEALRC